MTVEHTKTKSKSLDDEFTVFSNSFEAHKIRFQIERYNVWIGTGDSYSGARFNLENIDELITVLQYVKWRMTNGRT